MSCVADIQLFGKGDIYQLPNYPSGTPESILPILSIFLQNDKKELQDAKQFNLQ